MKTLFIVFALCFNFAYTQNITIQVTKVNVDRIFQNIKVNSYVKNVNTTYHIDIPKQQLIVSFNKQDREDVIFKNIKIVKNNNVYTITYNDNSLYTDDKHIGIITIDTKLNKVVYNDRNVDWNFSDIYSFQVFNLIVQ